MRRVAFHPEALRDLTEAADFYEGRSPGLGLGLLAEVEQSLQQVIATPEAYQQIGEKVRRKPLWRFPYNIVYAVYPDRIRVVAFAHQKRRPFYWRRRLKNGIGGN